MIKNNWKKLVLYLSILLVYIINIILFMKEINSEYYPFFKDINRFSFWNYVMHENLATGIMFLLPILICVISVSDFVKKMKGSYLKSSLLRQKYTNHLRKELVKGYLKASIPFITISIIVFLIGTLNFKPEVTNVQYADLYSEFNYSTVNPYIHVILSFFLLAIFIGLIYNISLIIYRFLKKYSLTIILSFICINVLNYIVGMFLSSLSHLFTGSLAEMFYNFNLYSGYLGRYYIYFDFIIILILFIISLIMVMRLYQNKEKVVIDFE